MMTGVSVNRLQGSMLFEDSDPETIDTRFGRITLQKDNPITFMRGLLGMSDKFHFFLTQFPSEKMRRFSLLQSLDDYSLSFITLPLSLQNGIITGEDLSVACRETGLSMENLAILLIVSVHRTPQKISLSVNARAPLLIDSALRAGAQYVFQSDKYKVQHFITP